MTIHTFRLIAVLRWLRYAYICYWIRWNCSKLQVQFNKQQHHQPIIRSTARQVSPPRRGFIRYFRKTWLSLLWRPMYLLTVYLLNYNIKQAYCTVKNINQAWHFVLWIDLIASEIVMTLNLKCHAWPWLFFKPCASYSHFTETDKYRMSMQNLP